MSTPILDKLGQELYADDTVVYAVRPRRGSPQLRMGIISELLGQGCVVVKTETRHVIRCRADGIISLRKIKQPLGG